MCKRRHITHIKKLYAKFVTDYSAFNYTSIKSTNMKFIPYIPNSDIFTLKTGIIARFRKLREENSSTIPTQWIYRRINAVLNLLLSDQSNGII